MSLFNKFESKYQDLKDTLGWHTRHGNPILYLSQAYNFILDKERGTEFPYYFPEVGHKTKLAIKHTISALTNITHLHELEINTKGKENITKYRRFFYFLQNFYIYSNPTMSNLYYYSNAKASHIQRMESFYNYAFLTWFAYNTIAAASLVAVTNYYVRHHKANATTALVATVPLFALTYINYKVSDGVKNYFVNNAVRRLGYGHLTVGQFKHYPRNVEFTAY